MQRFLKRTWANIDLSCIEYNYRLIRDRYLKPQTKLLAVVKANAYGHGDRVVSELLDRLGADWFGVSNIEEAISLRREGIQKPILIFGHTPCELAGLLAKQQITQTCYSPEYARELSEQAQKQQVTVDVHIKVDSGMSRIGFVCNQLDSVESCCNRISEVFALPGLHVTGIFTHFACSDEYAQDSVDFTKGQFERYQAVCRRLSEQGHDLGIRHCCNSAAIMNYPEMHLDMVRPGVILYGCAPSGEMQTDFPFHPAMELKTTVSEVKELLPGNSISYGRIYTADHPIRVASVTIGYADSYPRVPSKPAYVLIHGKKAPVIGRVCMDQMMIDITEIDGVKMGDIATVFGRDGESQISLEEFAALRDSVNYESMCAVGIRVPRVYLKDGNIIDVRDYVSCVY